MNIMYLGICNWHFSGKHQASIVFGSLQHKIQVEPQTWALGKGHSRQKEEKGGGTGRIMGSHESAESFKKENVNKTGKLADLTMRKLLATLERKLSVEQEKRDSSETWLSHVQPPFSHPPLVSPQWRKEWNPQSALLNYMWVDCSSDSKDLADKTSFPFCLNVCMTFTNLRFLICRCPAPQFFDSFSTDTSCYIG